MDLIVRRERCSRAFDRSSLAAINGIPQEEVHATVDRVEIAADNFKFKRCAKILISIFFIILVVSVVKFAIKRHMRSMRHAGQVRGWCGTQAPQGDSRGYRGPLHFSPLKDGVRPFSPRGQGERPEGDRPEGDRPEGNERRHHGRRGCHKGERGQRQEQQQGTQASNPTVEEPKRDQPKPVEAPAVPPRPVIKDEAAPITTEGTATTTSTSTGSAPSNPTTPIEGPFPMPPVTAEGSEPYEGYRRHDEMRRRWKMMMNRWRRRHHKKRCCGGFLFFLFGAPLLIFLVIRCKRRRIHKRISKLLEIENRFYRAKYGCEWSIDKKLTNLTLKRVVFDVQPVQMQQFEAYPESHHHHHHAHHPQQQQHQVYQHPTPFTETAPLFTERPAQVRVRGGYERISLDDSSIGYK